MIATNSSCPRCGVRKLRLATPCPPSSRCWNRKPRTGSSVRIDRLRKVSRLPSCKTWETFEHDRMPLSLRQQLDQLANGDFQPNTAQRMAFGLPGTDPRPVRRQVEAGHRFFAPAYRLVQELIAAKRTSPCPGNCVSWTTSTSCSSTTRATCNRRNEERLIAERYERRSPPLVFSEIGRQISPTPWQPPPPSARVVHHSVILEQHRTGAAQQRGQSEAREPAKLIHVTGIFS